MTPSETAAGLAAAQKPEIVYLSDFDGSRANNFTTIRIFLAWSVLYGHSFAIAKLPGVVDPVTRLFQGSVWIGEIAVNGFFALSGFLVTGSFVRRGVVDYTLSRGLRIFPALFMCVVISVLILGPAVTTLGASEYFASPQVWSYLKNALAFLPIQWTLPGVFEDNVQNAVNGSLWTLTVEVRCYALLALLGVFGLLRHRHVANTAVLLLFVFALHYFSDIPLVGFSEAWARPCGYFLMGVFIYLNRDKIILDGRFAVLALLLIAGSIGQEWFRWVFAPCFVYLLFFLAYRTPYLHADERVGDISYGLYIFAWPVQQVVVLLLPGMHPYLNAALSSCLVIPIAWLSWHYLERPMLSQKSRLLRTKVAG